MIFLSTLRPPVQPLQEHSGGGQVLESLKHHDPTADTVQIRNSLREGIAAVAPKPAPSDTRPSGPFSWAPSPAMTYVVLGSCYEDGVFQACLWCGDSFEARVLPWMSSTRIFRRTRDGSTHQVCQRSERCVQNSELTSKNRPRRLWLMKLERLNERRSTDRQRSGRNQLKPSIKGRETTLSPLRSSGSVNPSTAGLQL